MTDIVFESKLVEVLEKLDQTTEAFLYEVGSELRSQVQRNTIADTGRTRGTWELSVDKDKNVAYVGSNYDNALWEEFGTGIYALNGDGRPTGWAYQDDKGEWHFTRGKKPKRALHRALETVKPQVMRYVESLYGQLGGDE